MNKTLLFLLLLSLIPGFAETNTVETRDLNKAELESIVSKENALAILCVAPQEQHGNHLPLGTDIFLSEYFASRLSESFGAKHGAWSILRYPGLHYSPNTASSGFSGNTNTSNSALYETLILTFKELHETGIDNVIIIDNHLQPGAQSSVDEALQWCNRTWNMKISQPLAAIIFDDTFRENVGSFFSKEERSLLDYDIHAGLVETSMMLYIDASQVKMENLRPDDDFPLSQRDFGMKMMYGKTMKDAGSPRGTVGSPGAASAEFGEVLVENLVAELVDSCERIYIDDDRSHLKERRTWFSSVPMQGSKYIFPYIYPTGTDIDGFIPAVALVGQSSGNIGLTSITGYGLDSQKPLTTSRLVLGQFFFNALEPLIEISNMANIQRISAGTRIYLGFNYPDFEKRSPSRIILLHNQMKTGPVMGNDSFNTDGDISSLSVAYEYNPQLSMPFYMSELNLGDFAPVYFKISYNLRSRLFYDAPYDSLELDSRFVLNTWMNDIKCALATYFFTNDVWMREDYLPDTLSVSGNGSRFFRGYQDYRDQLFSKILMESVELRYLNTNGAGYVLSGFGMNLGFHGGWGSRTWDDMFQETSFRLSSSLGIMFQPSFIPFYFRQDFATPLYGDAAFREFNVYFGLGYAY